MRNIPYNYTSQRAIRAAFWQAARNGEFGPLDVTPRRIRDYSGKGKMHNTDTRCAFTDFVDHLSRAGQISHALAHRVTLD